MFFTTAYVVMTRGFFNDSGLDVGLTTANGCDKAMAALLAGAADIALMGRKCLSTCSTANRRKRPEFSAS
ncbi:ABC transporter substrate-binding protein [Polaromonas sp.]|uniref:ABC transporter substrate-binding protein n=1 Tax=Polaromonas sp. TaxID=1869339 RepID=UPI0018082A1B|nr:ABC transporter substrate-binding protein [Polaromonas sp.]